LSLDGKTLVYSTFLGGEGRDYGCAIAVDESGQAYVTGEAGDNFPTTGGAYDPNHNGNIDAFVTKLNASGTASSTALMWGARTSTRDSASPWMGRAIPT
jgi:hypothetical protein